MVEALASLEALFLDRDADIGVLDMGLSSDQIDALKAKGCAVVTATWALPVPEALRIPYQVGYVARTALRDYFPGYQVYLWFDADAWAQTPEFFKDMVDGAKSTGAAIVRENGPGCRRSFIYNKWWYGHMITSYGIMDGIKIGSRPAINTGILALSDTAPHWEAWRKHYTHMIEKRQRTILDQHSFNAAVELDHLPSHLSPASCNWVATLSHPYWNPETKMLCEPDARAKPLSVVHMAGPDKKRTYQLKTTTGGVFPTDITYSTIRSL